MIYLDTHAMVFVYEGDLGRLGGDALRAIEEDDDLRISPMVLLELELLHEIKRIRTAPRRLIESLRQRHWPEALRRAFRGGCEQGV